MELMSYIYEGTTLHSRASPKRNSFLYNIFMVYMDLGELESGLLERWPWFTSKRTYGLSSFHRNDHLALKTEKGMKESVHDVVKKITGRTLHGPVRLLTNLRYMGIGFNPVSFYYVFDEGDNRVEAVVAEVGNIPWFEQHLYVALRGSDAPEQSEDKLMDFGEQVKEFHVSPFIKMDGIHYRWGFNDPATDLLVNVSLHEEGKNFFYANLTLKRRKFSIGQLMRQFILQPLFTVQEAVKLYRKDFKFFSHPEGAETGASKLIERIAGFALSFSDSFARKTEEP